MIIVQNSDVSNRTVFNTLKSLQEKLGQAPSTEVKNRTKSEIETSNLQFEKRTAAKKMQEIFTTISSDLIPKVVEIVDKQFKESGTMPGSQNIETVKIGDNEYDLYFSRFVARKERLPQSQASTYEPREYDANWKDKKGSLRFYLKPKAQGSTEQIKIATTGKVSDHKLGMMRVGYTDSQGKHLLSAYEAYPRLPQTFCDVLNDLSNFREARQRAGGPTIIRYYEPSDQENAGKLDFITAKKYFALAGLNPAFPSSHSSSPDYLDENQVAAPLYNVEK